MVAFLYGWMRSEAIQLGMGKEWVKWVEYEYFIHFIHYFAYFIFLYDLARIVER